MLLVRVLSFGSSWWARFGHDPADRYRFTRHAAYFNSTGFHFGNKVRRHWIVPGLLRFNGVGDFNPHYPEGSIGATFECADVTFAFGGKRLLFGRRVQNPPQPDYYLLAVKSESCGAFDCRLRNWKSETSRPIALSHNKDRLEALLLMRPGDWVRTNLGAWRLVPTHSSNRALLMLEEGSD